MASATRLARLRHLVQADLEALPERSPSPEPGVASDDESSGGVPLGIPASKQLTPDPTPSFVTSSSGSPTTTNPPIPEEAPIETHKQTHKHNMEGKYDENDERRFTWVKGAASSYNLGSKPKLSALPISKLDPAVLKKGELARQEYFTPIVALSKYPYLFCNKDCMQEIASLFFDAGKFWDREWDLYYLWDIEETRPLILVSESQFEHLLEEINSVLELGLRITNQQRKDGLVSRFPDHPRCLPRYLGRSNSRDEYSTMVKNVPDASSHVADELESSSLDDRSLDDFKKMMEDLWDLQKAKGKFAKAKKRIERIAKQKTFNDQFKRAQRYLGLRPTVPIDQSTSGLPPAVDTSLPAPFPFDRSVVFVCVDVESFERAHHKITEIGIATLDTRDLAGIAPGKDGENWRPQIRARHFRIQEYAHLVNNKFVSGCPDRFDFGTSEWVHLKEAPAKVASCFKPPFSAHTNVAAGEIVTMLNSMDLSEERNLIFLGHDALGDVKYLQALGFDPLTLPNILEAQDTGIMYRVWRREFQQTSLGRILYDFDILGYNLHNAGNDAVFTVQAMLAVCVREASIRGSREMKDIRDENMATKLANAQVDAIKQAEDDAAGWSDNEADGDGGAPVPIVIKSKPLPPKSRESTPSSIRGRAHGRRDSWNGRGQPINSNNNNNSGGYRHPRYAQRGGSGSPAKHHHSNSRGQRRGQNRVRSYARNSSTSASDDGFLAPGPEQAKFYW